MKYEYKCVLFNNAIQIDKNNTLGQAIQKHQDHINDYAADGWEYWQTNHFVTRENPGCLTSLFGGQPVIINHDFIVFRRELA